VPPISVQALPPLAARWIKANAYAAIASVVASLLIFGLKRLLGIDAKSSAAMTAVFLVTAGTIYGMAGAAWGLYTGAVLQRITPMLPAHGWIALHAALAALALMLSELMLLAPVSEAAAETKPTEIADIVTFALALGGTVGALTGAVEALLLQKAARGLATWIIWSAVSFAVYVAIVTGIEGPRAASSGLATELGSQAIGFIASVISSVVMLPALRRLEPL
jgi:hypothetical protein